MRYWHTSKFEGQIFHLLKNQGFKIAFLRDCLGLEHCTLCKIRLPVHPNYRRFGIGKKLVKKLEEKAVDSGFAHMYLETANVDPTPSRMYEKLGYQFFSFKDFECSIPFFREITQYHVKSFTKRLQ